MRTKKEIDQAPAAKAAKEVPAAPAAKEAKEVSAAPAAKEEKVRKRPGRQPMTAEEKEAAARARAAEKEKADNLRPDIFVQYQDGEVDMAALVEAARADFRKTKKRTLVTAMRIYFKPEESAAYYVINDNYEGKITV